MATLTRGLFEISDCDTDMNTHVLVLLSEAGRLMAFFTLWYCMFCGCSFWYEVRPDNCQSNSDNCFHFCFLFFHICFLFCFLWRLASKLSLRVIVLPITFQRLRADEWRLLSNLVGNDNNSLAVKKKGWNVLSLSSLWTGSEEMPQEDRKFPYPRGMLRTMLAP